MDDSVTEILSQVPSEILGLIFGYVDLATIEALGSISEQYKAMIKNSVTSLCGDRQLEEISAFPHIRHVFGSISVRSKEEFDSLIRLDLPTFTVRLLSNITMEMVAAGLQKLSKIESVTFHRVIEMIRLHDPPITSTRETTFSLNEGMADSYNIEWVRVLSQFNIPFRGWTVRMYDSRGIDGLVLPHIDRLLFDSCLFTQALPQILKRVAPNVRFILSSGIHGNFDPSLYSGSYPLVETIQVPIHEEQICDLVRIFPNVKNVVLFPVVLRIANYKELWANKQYTPKAVDIRDLYPSISFTRITS